MIKMNKTAAVRFLSRTWEDRAFWCNDGKIFHNLEELNIGLKSMAPSTFLHHANTHKNDFSKWIADVLGDSKLAEDLIKAKNKTEATKKVGLRVAYLKRMAK